MNTPISVGWPQLLLLIVLVAGVGLLIASALGLVGRRDYDDDDDYGRHRRRRRRRRGIFGWKSSLAGLILLGVGIFLIWVAISVQAYLGLTGEIQVAQIRATKIEGLPHQMSVEMTMYDKDGHPTSSKTYLVEGDEWMLQGNIIKFHPFFNILGIHSSYKLTRLEGRYDDVNMERNSKHTVIELNGGDDNFFKTVQQQVWMSYWIDAAYGNAVFLMPDGRTYNVMVSQTGLLARPDR